jgi:polysaccharide biosynthesis transport protein
LIGGQSNLPAGAQEPQDFSVALPADEEQTGGGFTLLQLWHMFYAHLWLSIAIFLLMVTLGYTAIKKMPKTYQATATLIVNSDNTDPLAGRNQGVGQTYSFFPTQVELINNNVVLRPVVERLGLQEDPEFSGGFSGDKQALFDTVLNNLRSSLEVKPGSGSQMLYISVVSGNAMRAAEIANAISDEYLRQTGQRTNKPNVERASRYSEQLAELKQNMDQAQAKVAEFRQRNGMADLKDGAPFGDSEGAKLGDLQNRLLEAQNARRQAENQVNTPEAAAMRGKLDQLQSELRQAQTTQGMGPQHPRVLQLQREITATSRALTDSTTVVLERARELENNYQAEVTAARNQLLDRRNVQDQGAKLLLEQQLARDAYAAALRGLDQVQFASVGNYQDVQVVSRAEPPVKSSKPNKLKLFLMVLVASGGLAVAGPFAFELLLNRRIRCRDDLERHFRIAMLEQFGRMSPAPR